MTPGPKKKNFNRRGGENTLETKKNAKLIPERQTKEIKDSSPNNIDDESSDSFTGKVKTFSKRKVSSNWAKYEEPVKDPHADTMRGEDFAVLSSYSGGSESQLQLQEERDWDESVGDKSVTIDLQDLINAVKSIPFHKQINLPEDIFSDEQLLRFVSASENYAFSKSNLDETAQIPEKKLARQSECLDSELNIIESYESEETVADALVKPFILEEKTENIIESLASCLSLKNMVPEKTVDELKTENEKPLSSVPDDLDFLLSLSVSSKNLKQEEKSSNKKQTNVDDWLNSILDD